mmetsp:Transcript_16120/g.36860  ORF Transcript_16120/g.36860 Transcript_16120/m.36860 type:complete len:310 (+) Transcript_16120:2024-2953(+)
MQQVGGGVFPSLHPRMRVDRATSLHVLASLDEQVLGVFGPQPVDCSSQVSDGIAKVVSLVQQVGVAQLRWLTHHLTELVLPLELREDPARERRPVVVLHGVDLVLLERSRLVLTLLVFPQEIRQHKRHRPAELIFGPAVPVPQLERQRLRPSAGGVGVEEEGKLLLPLGIQGPSHDLGAVNLVVEPDDDVGVARPKRRQVAKHRVTDREVDGIIDEDVDLIGAIADALVFSTHRCLLEVSEFLLLSLDLSVLVGVVIGVFEIHLVQDHLRTDVSEQLSQQPPKAVRTAGRAETTADRQRRHDHHEQRLR